MKLCIFKSIYQKNVNSVSPSMNWHYSFIFNSDFCWLKLLKFWNIFHYLKLILEIFLLNFQVLFFLKVVIGIGLICTYSQVVVWGKFELITLMLRALPKLRFPDCNLLWLHLLLQVDAWCQARHQGLILSSRSVKIDLA